MALACLIALAGLGIGLAGAVPVLSSARKEDRSDVKIELVESEDQEVDVEEEASIT